MGLFHISTHTENTYFWFLVSGFCKFLHNHFPSYIPHKNTTYFQFLTKKQMLFRMLHFIIIYSYYICLINLVIFTFYTANWTFSNQVAQATSNQMPKRDPLRHCMDIIDKMVQQMVCSLFILIGTILSIFPWAHIFLSLEVLLFSFTKIHLSNHQEVDWVKMIWIMTLMSNQWQL